MGSRGRRCGITCRIAHRGPTPRARVATPGPLATSARERDTGERRDAGKAWPAPVGSRPDGYHRPVPTSRRRGRTVRVWDRVDVFSSLLPRGSAGHSTIAKMPALTTGILFHSRAGSTSGIRRYG
jgi:hypothetical protein